jgi:membrane-associated phospholipid phosphatase
VNHPWVYRGSRIQKIAGMNANKHMNEGRGTQSESNKPTSNRRGVASRLARVETAYLLVLIAFASLAFLAHSDSYFNWDLSAARKLQAMSLPGFGEVMRIASVPGDRWIPYAITALSVAALLLFRFRSEAAGLSLSAGGAELLNRLVKLIVARPRPTADQVSVFRHLTSESFPSGHVTFYVCYFGFLFFMAFALLPKRSTARRLALLFTALPIVLIGFSRVYLGAHWPSDVLGAYLFGGLWLALCLDLYRRWKVRPRKGDEPKNR